MKVQRQKTNLDDDKNLYNIFFKNSMASVLQALQSLLNPDVVLLYIF